jgi:hypothetical protein
MNNSSFDNQSQEFNVESPTKEVLTFTGIGSKTGKKSDSNLFKAKGRTAYGKGSFGASSLVDKTKELMSPQVNGSSFFPVPPSPTHEKSPAKTNQNMSTYAEMLHAKSQLHLAEQSRMMGMT